MSVVPLISTTANDELLDDVVNCLQAGTPVRRDIGTAGRLHIDRPLPFLCVHIAGGTKDLAARDVVAANASYLIANTLNEAAPLIRAVGNAMRKTFGAFMLLDVGELEHDILLADDSPYLPHFNVSVSASNGPEIHIAMEAFIKAVCDAEVMFRIPRITAPRPEDDPQLKLRKAGIDFPSITVRYAPIYRQPESGAFYPDLRERLISNISDAGLQAFAAYSSKTGALETASHRALGRKAFVDAVRRADRAMDEIVSSFDFLLAVTPINAGQAFKEFEKSDFEREPKFLYRPLGVDVEAQKRKLYSIAFEHLEDPVLYRLYREKQQETDLQLTMLRSLNTHRFTDFSRALYGPVEDNLLSLAKDVLAHCKLDDDASEIAMADCYEVAQKSRDMVAAYHDVSPEFSARVEIRDDLPPGLMVTGSKLLVSRHTLMERRRIDALLSHEIGVHLLTYFNGSSQGLRVFRNGLSGYEGVQEGLAVLAEYLTGGMTRERLRLIAARVVACAAMLDGASFTETFHLMTKTHGLSAAGAFNLTLRIYRGGGLSKDAIYLRGLAQVVFHLRDGGSLDPFWMGKIAADHFPIMQELAQRGLLRSPNIYPAFLADVSAKKRLEDISKGLPISDMANL
jgi:uncharacterized protein (TIGR02421 family)